MAQPKVIPLSIAEFLRVTLALAKQSHALDADTKAHIGEVLKLYEVGRDEYLLNQGFTQKQIDGLAQSAALALANHFEDKANAADEEEAGDLLELPVDDFSMDDFERQFDGDHHPNPD